MAARDSLTVKKKGGEKRRGRGFSRGELRQAGITIGQALRVGLSVDVRRRTVHDENVKLVQQQLGRLEPMKKDASKRRTKSSQKS